MKKKNLLTSIVALLLPMTLAAQYTIYPIPQQQTAGTGTVSFTAAVTAVCDPGIDEYTQERLTDVLAAHGVTVAFAAAPSADNANVFLGINGSGGAADAKATELGLSRSVFSTANKYDRHLLSLTAGSNGHAQLVIIGENTDATFFGLASLEQMLDNGTGNLTCVTIQDYADQKSRGLVEGYYGVPYSVDVKKDLMRFMMRHKMNTYLYGAKSDPYHSNYWQDAYPETLTEEQVKNGWLSQDNLRDITDVSHRTKVNFIWAIHPGNSFVGSSTVVNDIMGKFEKMYELGVRQFGVFVDDVSIPSTTADMRTNANRLTALQEAIEEKWNKTYTNVNDTVRPLHFVPQIYCRNFASSETQYNSFFQALSSTPSQVTIYTTGYGVWSVPNESDLSLPKEQLGRNVAWWWNYPCNDNGIGPSQIYPMDMYSNFSDMPNVTTGSTLPTTLDNGLGVVSNPMQQGEVAKTALFSVADFAWNTDGFSNESSWEASFKGVLPGNEAAQKAYRFLAPYLRYYDTSELNTLISQYKSSKDPTAIAARMTEIIENCDEIIKLKDSEVDGERLLYTDLEPWLLKLRAMASVNNELLALAQSEDTSDEKWAAYLEELTRADGLSTDEDYYVYMLTGTGTGISSYTRLTHPGYQYMLPFVEYMKEHALDGYFTADEEETKAVIFKSSDDIRALIAGANASPTVNMSRAATLQPGDYVGIKLPLPTTLAGWTISDTLAANHTVLYSADGKTWTRVTDVTTVPEDYVRYLVVANDGDTPESIRLYNGRSLLVDPTDNAVITEGTVPEESFWDGHSTAYMYDGDYSTFVCMNRNQESGDTYVVKLSEPQPIKRVRIVMGTTNDDYMTVGRVQVSADGTSWTSIKVLGTTVYDYTMGLAHNYAVHDEAKACDFDGGGRTAQYVRLNLTTPNTNKWLRLYEIEVNGEDSYLQKKFQDKNGRAYDGATDRNASTSTGAAVKTGSTGEFVYYFQDYSYLTGVSLYCQPATLENATFSVTNDGTNWTPVEPEGSNGVLHIDLSDGFKSATALKITWTGTVTPAIHELFELLDETEVPIVSRIGQVTVDGPASGTASLDWNGGKLTATSAAGLASVEVYGTDGRKMLSLHPAGAQTVSIPGLRSVQQALVVKVTQSDGSVQSFKVM